MSRKSKLKSPRTIAVLKFREAAHKNIPAAEFLSVMRIGRAAPIQMAFPYRGKVESGRPREVLDTIRGPSWREVPDQ